MPVASRVDPAAQAMFDLTETGIGAMIAMLRATVAADVDDPRLTELVGELSVKSELFRRVWARHDVRTHPPSAIHRLSHPQVGELELRFDKFAVYGAQDQLLVVYQAEPGSVSAEALTLLGSLADTEELHDPHV